MQTNVEEISDDDILYRRLQPFAVDEDGTANSLAFAFKPGDDGISVDLARLTTAEKTLSTRPDFGLGAIKVGDIRRLGLIVQHEPDDKNNNPAHTLIIGEFTKLQRRELAKAMQVLIRPTAPRKYNN